MRMIPLLAVMVATLTGQLASSNQKPNPQIPKTVPVRLECSWILDEGPQFEPVAHVCQAAQFTNRDLPNFVCDQTTWRSNEVAIKKQVGRKVVTGKRPMRDVITSEVRYIDGKTEYVNVRANGRPTNLDFPLRGMWTEGEFAPPGLCVVGSQTRPIFVYRGEDDIDGMSAQVFDYEVSKDKNQSWKWKLDNEEYLPSFRGSLWIEKSTGRLLRVSQEAFDVDGWVLWKDVAVTTDYRNVKIPDLGEYSLPVGSVTKSCTQNDPLCSTNTIAIRNCRKFAAKAHVVE